MLLFTVLWALAFAEDSTQQAFPGPGIREQARKNEKVDKSTKAYRQAKHECLKRGGDLKGKKLTDCIVEYQREAK